MPRSLPDTVLIEWPQSLSQPAPDTERALDRAADLLRHGGLVAIPTETVYGLAADALNATAIEKIFRAKQRPATNPLIVHVVDVGMAQSLAAEWPAAAAAITAELWPGPVTVVVPRGTSVPDTVTAGGATVALRCPQHRLTRRLIEKLGRPLAAPSANRSEAVSPTTAHHVLESLGNRIDLILNGGSCDCGIESTVVDCTQVPARILRPGPISRQILEEVLGRGMVVESDRLSRHVGLQAARAPGQHARHYAPQTPLELSTCAADRVACLLRSGKRIGWLTTQTNSANARLLAQSRELVIVPMPEEPVLFARQLYATLHAIDQRGLDAIVVDAVPDTEAWQAVRDRLLRAATPAPAIATGES
ncbi:MAG: threonylcarbamoyl-AMP synthase [Planctomycetota bacterium]|nr:MAG: threonylcarbamoyl-AMP synthase [Planctomycetota bacterium]